MSDEEIARRIAVSNRLYRLRGRPGFRKLFGNEPTAEMLRVPSPIYIYYKVWPEMLPCMTR
jgi:hypothetical protein